MVVGPTLRRKELMDIAGFLEIEDAIEPIIMIAKEYSCQRTRHSAIQNILRIDPSQVELLEFMPSVS